MPAASSVAKPSSGISKSTDVPSSGIAKSIGAGTSAEPPGAETAEDPEVQLLEGEFPEEAIVEHNNEPLPRFPELRLMRRGPEHLFVHPAFVGMFVPKFGLLGPGIAAPLDEARARRLLLADIHPPPFKAAPPHMFRHDDPIPLTPAPAHTMMMRHADNIPIKAAPSHIGYNAAIRQPGPPPLKAPPLVFKGPPPLAPELLRLVLRDANGHPYTNELMMRGLALASDHTPSTPQ
jgi:hypothetical protein